MFNAVNKSLSGSLVSAFNGIAFLSPTKNHHSSPYPLPASSSSTLCESSKYLKEIHCSVTKVSFTCTQTGLTQSKCPTQWEVLKFGYVKKESTKVLSCLNFLVEGRNQLCLLPLLLRNAVEEQVSEKHWHCGRTGSPHTVHGQRTSL